MSADRRGQAKQNRSLTRLQRQRLLCYPLFQELLVQKRLRNRRRLQLLLLSGGPTASAFS